MKRKHLYEMTWQEAEKAIKSSKGVAIIPVGSIEQHGPHLPVGTDSFVAIGLADAALEQTDVLVCPPLWLGYCPHHMVLPGSISIRPEILIGLAYDVMKSLHTHGVDKFIFINGHRIVNIIWLQLAAEKAQNELGVKVKIFDPAYMSKELIDSTEGMGPVGHAEEIESSHMMVLHPELTHMELAEDHPVKATELYSVDPGYPKDTLCYVPTACSEAAKHVNETKGVSGCPTKSNKEFGQKYHDYLTARLLQVIEALRSE
jgi:creatinine amidohydrolase